MKSLLSLIIFLAATQLVVAQITEPDSTSTAPPSETPEQHPDSLESELFFSDPNVASHEVIVSEKDVIRKEHSPTKAALFSAVVPGLGQAYNKKYWKIPIVYAGLGVSVYFLQYNIGEINYFREQYRRAVDPDPTIVNTSGYNTATLQDLITQHRKWRDYSYLGLVAVYLLNILDANVDAHLFYFDVSKDLSMGVYPSLQGTTQPSPGLTLCLKL